jgi:hypothetical protein
LTHGAGRKCTSARNNTGRDASTPAALGASLIAPRLRLASSALHRAKPPAVAKVLIGAAMSVDAVPVGEGVEEGLDLEFDVPGGAEKIRMRRADDMVSSTDPEVPTSLLRLQISSNHQSHHTKKADIHSLYSPYLFSLSILSLSLSLSVSISISLYSLSLFSLYYLYSLSSFSLSILSLLSTLYSPLSTLYSPLSLTAR